jgi:deoxyribonuclease-4
MPLLIGAHLSVSKGYTSALDSIIEKGGNALQIFSTSPRVWKPAAVSDETCATFRDSAKRLGVGPVFFHASYLVNLADDGRIGNVSKESLIAEMMLQPRMGVSGSIIHLGSFKEKADDGLFASEQYEETNPKYATLIRNIRDILTATPPQSIFIIENVATRKIGKGLDELAKIVNDLDNNRVRICLDTCHLHAAGYDLSTQEKFDAFFAEFDAKIGMDRIALFHLNDSRDPFGSYRDRHANLTEGMIPETVFELLLNDPKTRDIPFILETPGFDGDGPDKENIDIAKSFAGAVGGTAVPGTPSDPSAEKRLFFRLFDRLEGMEHPDKHVLARLREFVRTNNALYRDGGSPEHHLCAFFVPIVPEQRLVFVGHHIKADDWIPPGGHMEPGETPLQTIRREVVEELSYELKDERIELFDVAIKDVSQPNRVCKTHNDLWYLIHMKKPVPFKLQASEFHDGAWLSYEEAISRMKTESFLPVMKHIRDLR